MNLKETIREFVLRVLGIEQSLRGLESRVTSLESELGAITVLETRLTSLVTVVQLHAKHIRAIEEALEQLATTVPAPGKVILRVVAEVNNMLKFELDLPPISAPDVIKRSLAVTIGSGTTIDLSPDPAAATISDERFVGQDNDQVTIVLTDTDDAGNVSPASTTTIILTDTIAPPEPGAVGLRVVAEQ